MQEIFLKRFILFHLTSFILSLIIVFKIYTLIFSWKTALTQSINKPKKGRYRERVRLETSRNRLNQCSILSHLFQKEYMQQQLFEQECVNNNCNITLIRHLTEKLRWMSRSRWMEERGCHSLTSHAFNLNVIQFILSSLFHWLA